VSTPKHDAKSLVKYSERHRDIEFTRIVFPQVPGTIRRSRPVRGVLESLFRAKKYMVALAVFHPFIAGGVVMVYLVGDRFDPARNALVFNANGDPNTSVTKDDRRTYLNDLKALAIVDKETDPERTGISWRQFEEKAQIQLDESGHPAMQVPVGQEVVEMGVSRDGLVHDNAPVQLQRGLIVARLRQELARSRAPRTSADGLHQDWQLLREIDLAEQKQTPKLISGGLPLPHPDRQVPPSHLDLGN